MSLELAISQTMDKCGIDADGPHAGLRALSLFTAAKLDAGVPGSQLAPLVGKLAGLLTQARTIAAANVTPAARPDPIDDAISRILSV